MVNKLFLHCKKSKGNIHERQSYVYSTFCYNKNYLAHRFLGSILTNKHAMLHVKYPIYQ